MTGYYCAADPHDWGVSREQLAAAVLAPDEHLNPTHPPTFQPPPPTHLPDPWEDLFHDKDGAA